ncbi:MULTISPECIES: hypothetical protein [unclassified Mesorhizobium]|uniref:hypothetical protein n=1 Tax=unclassified Mesorhizobium TaxID=325217 RepID=UPI001128793B|nr:MULTISPECIES: hypothetical protein [unclassified Mesorhizobium]MBZ9998928.1 hypothetical protein [Mesorhizobium sp. B264B2A]MCA0005473.1 hypothetical protein [Mesorhizobium sp. B264B1B]MCA0020601.1 hypothetical protein [Mesorhizobium sp. B264B1A]TPJ47039.1 hypothetical protein FJ437_12290 [Mesorhizobium sp. B2-6-6]
MTVFIPACIVAIMAFDGQAEKTVEEIDALAFADRTAQSSNVAFGHPASNAPSSEKSDAEDRLASAGQR